MPHRQLASPVLILGSFLVKAYLALTLDGGQFAERLGEAQRGLLQSPVTDLDTCEAIEEYDPVLDSPVELQSLTALWRATGGQYWTYGSYFQTVPTLSSLQGVTNQTAEAALIQRFNRTEWLDFSVSYCQWYATLPV